MLPSYLLTTSSAMATHAPRKNVLLLVVDDLRPELGAFGASHVHTPHLDSLAARSLVLKANYVNIPVCGPTRASFMTSRRPDTLRTVAHTSSSPQDQYWRLRAGNYTTLPQMFKDAGWWTSSVGKTFDLRTSSFNNSREWICDGSYSWSEPTKWCDTELWSSDAQLAKGGGKNVQSHLLLDAASEAKHSDVRIAAGAIARLNVSIGALAGRISPPLHAALSRATTREQRRGGGGGEPSPLKPSSPSAPLPSPWLLAVGFHRPHLPLLVPARHLDLYPTGSVPLPADPRARYAPLNMPDASSECSGTFSNTSPNGSHGCVGGDSSFELWQQYTYNESIQWGGWTGAVGQTLREDWASELKRYYYAAVSHTDEMVGAVLAAVRLRGDEGNTIVAVIGDHGWHLDDQGMFAKCTLFEAAARAPMLIAVPGLTDAVAGGHTSSQLTEHVDLLPTLAAAAGLPVPERCPTESRNDPNRQQPTLCTEGVNLLPLIANGSAPLRKATFSQWPHPFAGRPSAMGYSIRVTAPVNARYTEWLLMSYGPEDNSTQMPRRAGLHVPLWDRRCAHELYLYGGANGSSGAWETGSETENVVDDARHASLVEQLRAQLYLGWRAAVGPGPWPPLPAPPAPTELSVCPMTVIPEPPPLPPSPPSPAASWAPLPGFDFTEPPILKKGNENVQPTLTACEGSCAALASCNVGLWISGTQRHGECWLSVNKIATPRKDFCGAKPDEQCASFERRTENSTTTLITRSAAGWGYAAERKNVAAFLLNRYDPHRGLLHGVWAGGDGYQDRGYSLIDVNFFASRSLEPYNSTVAHAIVNATAVHLAAANYTHNDRRETMFGHPVSEVLTVDTHTLAGSFPAPPAPFWLATELVNTTRRAFQVGKPYGVNSGVTLALSLALAGDAANATKIMANIASWWNASNLCVMEPAAIHDKMCYTRAISYLLFGMRALRLDALLPAGDVAKMEAQLWRCQVVNCSTPCGKGRAIATTYEYGGEPMLRHGAHSSTEPSNLALLAYDQRILTEWFPAGINDDAMRYARAQRMGATAAEWAARWSETMEHYMK